MIEPLEIPPITDPKGQNWEQPDRHAILIDAAHALMTQDTFEELTEYSTEMPSGIFAGKMWKYLGPTSGKWFLCWFQSGSATGNTVGIIAARNGDSAFFVENREVIIA